MAEPRVFSLDSIRTDGWFERIGESVGSFQALCDIIGERFFAFSMITGARITALTVDRRDPDNTLVDFVVGAGEEQITAADTQRLTLADFRVRLVTALLAEEPPGPAPTRSTDTEGIQKHIGVRFLLLAPLYGFSLMTLSVGSSGSQLGVLQDGIQETYDLDALRLELRARVRGELEAAAQGGNRGAIDLSKVAEAESAAARGDHEQVIRLLGAWPAPLTIFLRTPEGQMLNAETRGLIARGLGLVGSACVAMGDVGQAEEIFRLAVQYAGEGATGAEVYVRLGEAVLADGRPGEALGPLRRAANLGAAPERVWPLLARAFGERRRYLAALGAILEAQAAGVSLDQMPPEVLSSVRRGLGAVVDKWGTLVEIDLRAWPSVGSSRAPGRS